MCIHYPDNFPIMFLSFLNLTYPCLPHMGSSDTISLRGNTSLHDKINWRKIDSASIEAYKICVLGRFVHSFRWVARLLNSRLQVASTCYWYACGKLFSCIHVRFQSSWGIYPCLIMTVKNFDRNSSRTGDARSRWLEESWLPSCFTFPRLLIYNNNWLLTANISIVQLEQLIY